MCVLVRVSDRTRLQKLFISVNTPFTRGFWAKIPVYESCAVGALLGDVGQLWAILGFSGLFLHKYAVYEGFLAILNILLQSLFPVNGFCPILVMKGLNCLQSEVTFQLVVSTFTVIHLQMTVNKRLRLR